MREKKYKSRKNFIDYDMPYSAIFIILTVINSDEGKYHLYIYIICIAWLQISHVMNTVVE